MTAAGFDTSIFQIDIAERKLARTIDIAPFNRLHGMQMDDQDRLFALSEDRAQLVVLDHPATDTAPRRAVPQVEVELTCPANGALSTVQLAISTV